MHCSVLTKIHGIVFWLKKPFRPFGYTLGTNLNYLVKAINTTVILALKMRFKIKLVFLQKNFLVILIKCTQKKQTIGQNIQDIQNLMLFPINK